MLWDWNGTLLADARLSYDIFVEVFEAAGKSCPSYDEWRDIVHFPIPSFYKSFMPQASAEEIKGFMGAWAERYEARRNACDLQPGAISVMTSLKQQSIVQSILSAHTKPDLIEAARDKDVLHFFEEIAALSPGRGGESKVALGKALIANIEERHGVKRSQHVIIGDSSHDAEVARELRIDCILIAAGIFSRRRLETLGFPVFNSLNELL